MTRAHYIIQSLPQKWSMLLSWMVWPWLFLDIPESIKTKIADEFDEILRLLLHGVLHVLGHDHENDADAREMEREHRRVRKLVDA